MLALFRGVALGEDSLGLMRMIARIIWPMLCPTLACVAEIERLKRQIGENAYTVEVVAQSLVASSAKATPCCRFYAD